MRNTIVYQRVAKDIGNAERVWPRPHATRFYKFSPLLSTLWIVVMITMVNADVLSLFIPGAADEVARTAVNAAATIPQLMLVGAIMGQLGLSLSKAVGFDRLTNFTTLY